MGLMKPFQIIILSMLSLLLLVQSLTPNDTIAINSFINCYQYKNLLFTPTSTSYQPILQSSAQNYHFLLDKDYTKPAVIITVTSSAHVTNAVTCARTNGIGLRVRSGGHDYEGMSYVAQGSQPFVVVDLAGFRSIDVNVASKRAWVYAGATLGELYYNVFTKSSGKLGFPAGTCPTVGVGGHISGGGIGTLARKYGMAADNVVDALIVDVNGRVLNRTTMGEDLFWAIRGGGAASFGVVIAYKVRLVDVPPVVTVFNVFRTLDQNATKLVARWQEVAPKFDKNLYIRIIAQVSTINNRDTIQAQFNSIYFGPRAQLLPLIASSFPELNVQSQDTTEVNWLQSVLFYNGNSVTQPLTILLNRTRQSNNSFKSKSDYVETPISEANWNTIWQFLIANKANPTWTMGVILEPYGGVMEEIQDNATPFPHRKGILFNVQYFLNWAATDEAVADVKVAVMRKVYAFMASFVSMNPRAAYLNYKDLDLGKDFGVKYFKGNFQRLVNVKKTVDPGNFFRNEQSIPTVITT